MSDILEIAWKSFRPLLNTCTYKDNSNSFFSNLLNGGYDVTLVRKDYPYHVSMQGRSPTRSAESWSCNSPRLAQPPQSSVVYFTYITPQKYKMWPHISLSRPKWKQELENSEKNSANDTVFSSTDHAWRQCDVADSVFRPKCQTQKTRTR